MIGVVWIGVSVSVPSSSVQDVTKRLTILDYSNRDVIGESKHSVNRTNVGRANDDV